ncbi:MAG: DUF547 domain-containing protein [Planctomycetota bacterium]|nr:DUF547 domain-containing protein [Planctomycetota bacterium]
MNEGTRSLVGGTVLALGFVLVWGLTAVADSKVHVGRQCNQQDRPSLAEVDHSTFDSLLRKYVDDRGLVGYARWKASADDLGALDDYLARAGCVDLKKVAPKSAQLAYWINLYNALTLKGIIREYPTSSIRNHTAKLGGYNVWKDLLVWVDGQQLSLDAIEHSILRKMGEPRIHLAVVCASRGCPTLWNRAYSAEDLDGQLTANGRRFLARPENFQAQGGSKEVRISKLFEWYGTDFAATPVGQLKALAAMLPAGTEWVTQGGVRVSYLDYDWSLNDQQPIRR